MINMKGCFSISNLLSYFFKLVQTCLSLSSHFFSINCNRSKYLKNLPKLVQSCPIHSNLVKTCLNLSNHVKTCLKHLFLNFSIKCNRSYTDFALYTMPVKPVIMSEKTLKELGVEINGTKMDVDTNNGQNGHDTFNSDDNPYFLQMEKRLCDLVQGGNLHWRHHQMAIGKTFRIFFLI